MQKIQVSENARDVLGSIITGAKRELGYIEHAAAGMDSPHAVTTKPAVSTGMLNLREHVLTVARDAENVVTRFPGGRLAGQTSMLSAAILERSRVAQAGAQIIIARERPAPTAGDVVALYRESARLDLVEAAQLTEVVDDADVAASALPMHSAAIEWPDAPSVACRFTVTRAQMRDIGGDQLQSNLVQSIVFGLAQAADRALLSAIVAATPDAFTLGAAAARNLEFSELRGFVGTSGTGAVVGQDGTLRASGVLAELTPTITGTLIGSFSRAAVGIHPDVMLHASRLSVKGDLEFVVFANLVTAIPDASAFWTVS